MDLLKQDLSTIFELNVLFDKFDFGKEQEVLFCDIARTTVAFENKEANEIIKIFGNLEYCMPNTRYDSTYLQKKFELYFYSNKIVKGTLNIDKTSLQINYTTKGQFYTKYSVGFSYFVRKQFNKSRTNITDLDIVINEK